LSVEIISRWFWFFFIMRCAIQIRYSVLRLALFALPVTGQSDYFGFSCTTLNCQSLYCVIRILLEAHENENISVRGYDRETEKQVKHFNLRKK